MYIYNSNNLTKEDYYVLIRRTITCQNTTPIITKYNNGWEEQDWYGDMTGWPGYVESTQEFKKE